MTIITLLTDFGCEDEYVAMMKGAILSINSAARLIDISHGIAPQNIARAGLAIENTYRYFPAGTIHAVVVDPEVGSDRAIIAMESRGHRFVGPDNGLFSRLLAAGDPDMLVAVSESAYFLKPVSRTFHGRDIIAPVAAHLSLGVEMNRLGRALRPDQLVFSAGSGACRGCCRKAGRSDRGQRPFRQPDDEHTRRPAGPLAC